MIIGMRWIRKGIRGVSFNLDARFYAEELSRLLSTHFRAFDHQGPLSKESHALVSTQPIRNSSQGYHTSERRVKILSKSNTKAYSGLFKQAQCCSGEQRSRLLSYAMYMLCEFSGKNRARQ